MNCLPCSRATILVLGSALLGQAQDPAANPPRIRQARPAAFHPERLSTVNGIAFAPGGRELFVSRRVEQTDAQGRQRVRIFLHRQEGESFGEPEPLSFSERYTDYQPVLSPSGERLFFTSTRPLPGASAEVRQNIWYVDRIDEEYEAWSAPQVVEELVTPGWDGYAVPTRLGNLYFVSERAGGLGGVDIWVASMDGDELGTPRNVTAVNSNLADSDLWVDPQERFLIFNRYTEATREIDLWISQRQGASFGAPRLLSVANGPGWELSPTVTPDGKSFFFQREGTLYQVDLALVLELTER